MADWECVRATSYMYPGHADDRRAGAAYQADGFELALHLSTGLPGLHAGVARRIDLTSQLAAFTAQLAEPARRRSPTARTASSGATGRRSPRSSARNGIRFDTNYYYIGPPGWLTQARPDDRLGLPAALRRPRRLDDRRLPGDDAGHRRGRGHAAHDRQMHSLLDGALDNALGSKGYYGVFNAILALRPRRPHASSTTWSPRRMSAACRWSPPRRCWTGSTAATARRSATSRTAAARSRFSLVTNDKARGLEAMLPARSATGPLSQADARRPAGVAGPAAPSRASTTSSSRALAGAYEATYETDTSAPGHLRRSPPPRTPRATRR